MNWTIGYQGVQAMRVPADSVIASESPCQELTLAFPDACCRHAPSLCKQPTRSHEQRTILSDPRPWPGEGWQGPEAPWGHLGTFMAGTLRVHHFEPANEKPAADIGANGRCGL